MFLLNKRRPDLWLPTYALTAASRAYGHMQRRQRLTHIIFLVCDHFEPRHGIKHDDQPFQRLDTWRKEYALFQQRCRASFGSSPLHTWFYPPHHGVEHLSSLAEMVFDGLGEVELHYHHHGDTYDSLKRDLGASIAEYHRWGLLLESGENPKTAFGFIHGDWALANSGHGKFCGVNDELKLLEEFGCWGDLTMPSGNECQTRKINSIYYASGDPQRPKSHNWGRDAQVGRSDGSGLLLMQGPLGINWRGPNHPRIENASLTTRNWGRPDRVRKWLDCNIHVKGRPEWQFVKLHTHGAIERDFDALFGDKAFAMHRILNEQYNDGRRYRLHYVTARQAYNIAKAAEDGKEGDPSEWLDYRIQPQAHAFYALDAAHDLRSCTKTRLVLANIEANRSVQLRTRVEPITQLAGWLQEVEVDCAAESMRIEVSRAGTDVILELDASCQLGEVHGGSVSSASGSSAAGPLSITAKQRQCVIKYRQR